MAGERREYFRVSTVLPLRARVLDPTEKDQIEGEIQLRRTPDLSSIDPALASRLDAIEDRLDRILEAIDRSPEAWVTPGGMTPIQLSGGGIRFPVRDAVPAGALLLIELVLGGVPRRQVRATARALAEKPPRGEDEPHAAVQFETITPEDRDAVVAYTLEVQRRETLRRKSGPEAGAA